MGPYNRSYDCSMCYYGFSEGWCRATAARGGECVMAAGQVAAFGALLRQYRRAAGLTQEALAERAGVTAQAISALERGIRRRPHPSTVRLLAAAVRLHAQDRAAFEAAVHRARDSVVRASARSQPARSSDLPSFVGRERELALLERHLGGEGDLLAVPETMG